MWNELKGCLLEASEETCGRTQGRPRHRETWWWTEDVAKAVKEKKRMFKISKKSKNESDRMEYYAARKHARKAVCDAQEVDRKRLGDKLVEEDRNGNLLRMAKQMVARNRDVVGGGCVKDSNGNVTVEQEKLMEVWRQYFQKLLNEEFVWNKESLGTEDAVAGPAEEITTSEVRTAISKMKSGKAAGPSGIAAEMLKAAGEDGVTWVTDICTSIVREGRYRLIGEKVGWCVCVQRER